MSATNQRSFSGPGCIEVLDCRDARLSIRSDQGLTLVSITGEIYASNVDQVRARVRTFVPRVGALIVDLSHIDFICVAGLGVLFSLNVECARVGTPWVVIAGASVSRLLRVGDPDSTLPTVASYMDALRYLRRAIPEGQRLALVAPTN
jgi:anti-anti-sigma factor